MCRGQNLPKGSNGLMPILPYVGTEQEFSANKLSKQNVLTVPHTKQVRLRESQLFIFSIENSDGFPRALQFTSRFRGTKLLVQLVP